MISSDLSEIQWGKLTSLNPNFPNISLLKNPSSLLFSSEPQVDSDENPLKSDKRCCRIYSDKEDFFIHYHGNDLATIQVEDRIMKKGEAFPINSGEKIKVIIKREKGDEITVEYIFSSELMQAQKGSLKREKEEKEEVILFEKQIKEGFEGEVNCRICDKMIYECVSVVPCLHNFCMDCLMCYLRSSQGCPKCHQMFMEFRRNAYLNNLIEGCERSNRSEEECRKVDEKLNTERVFAMFEYANGDVYEGEWKKCKRDGRGRLVDCEGNILYEGDWKNGYMEGKGKMILADGDVYEGDFKEDTMNGKGKMVFENGDIYEGDWKDGCLEGQGRMEYESGEVYEGEWKGDQRDGWGKIKYVNGTVWEGNFRRNRPDLG